MASERILTRDHLSVISPGVTKSGRWRGYCPFHAGSTAFDLEIDPMFARFCCIVCGVSGWTESGYQRHQERIAASVGDR